MIFKQIFILCFLFIQGYNNKHGYIATQHPLKETIDDFWRMIHQDNVKTIVMLNKLKENGVVSLFYFSPLL